MANAATHRRKPGPREAEQLQALAQAPETEPRMRERAKLILHWMEGETPDEIVQKTGMSRSMVFRWRARYNQEGVQGLMDRPRTGKPRVYDEDFERRTLALLQQEPPAPMAFWTASALARRLDASPDAIWRLLRRHGISLARRRVWKVQAEVLLQPWEREAMGIYIAPPIWILITGEARKSQHPGLLMTWEKNAGSALQSAAGQNGWLPMEDALGMMAQFQAGTMSENRRRESVQAFLNDVVDAFGPELPLALHAVGDVCALLPANWQAEHPKVQFHFYASKETALAAIARLPYAQGQDAQALIEQVDHYPADALPFVWRKR